MADQYRRNRVPSGHHRRVPARSQHQSLPNWRTVGLSDPRLVHRYTPGPRLGATSTIGVPSDGGLSVPTQFFSQWLNSSLENEIIRSGADIRPMTSSDAAAARTTATHSSTLFSAQAA